MNEVMERFLAAIQGDGDIGACAELIATNFPAFMENDVLREFPKEVLFGVMANEHITFPDPDKTTAFFSDLFSRGEEYVQMFFELIPFDELTSSACESLASKLEELDFVLEARRMRRIKNLYQTIDSLSAEQKGTSEKFAATADQLGHSSELLEKMTALLKNQSDALQSATEELARQAEQIKQKDALISRLQGGR